MNQSPPPSAGANFAAPPGAQPPYTPVVPSAAAPAKAQLSAAAVGALVAAALAVVPLGVVLGIVALFRTQRFRLRGRRLAVIALSMCAGWTALGMVAIIASAAVIGSHQGALSAFGAGTCYTYSDGSDTTQGIDVVPCGQPHDGEIIARHGLGSHYPGDAAAPPLSVVGCVTDSARAIPDAGRPDPVVTRLKVAVPTQASWDSGMRAAVCILTHVDRSAMVGDVLDGSGLTPLQRRVLQLTNETVLLRLKLHDVPSTAWSIAAPLEQSLAEADRAESAALTALAADPPAGATSGLPSALRTLADADATEASQAAATTPLITGPQAWQAQLDAGRQTSPLPAPAYAALRTLLGLPRSDA